MVADVLGAKASMIKLSVVALCVEPSDLPLTEMILTSKCLFLIMDIAENVILPTNIVTNTTITVRAAWPNSRTLVLVAAVAAR